jgi:glycosyltransferase involved in cell wall biosynthesis
VEIWRKGLCRQGIDTGTVDFSPTHVCFVSEFLRDDFRQAGIEYPSTEIIYGGVDAAKFFYQRESVDAVTDPLRLLYAGQITWDRGLQTVIDALSLLSREVLTHTTLTVVGDGFEPIFPRNMRQKVEDLGLSKQVIFVGKRSYDQMPEIYRCHDVLIAPSLRKEGLPLTMTEAMLSGCAVVTSGSGGAIEIAQMAGLPLFPKGNAPALSEILENLILDRQRVEQIGRRGQRVAMREFSSDRMVQRVCQTFEQLFQAHSKGEPSKNPIPDYHQQFDPTASRSSS